MMEDEERELYWYDDATYDIGFYNYYQRTVDPSPWAFLVCSFYCAILAIILPRHLSNYRALLAKKQEKAARALEENQPRSIIFESQKFIASNENLQGDPPSDESKTTEDNNNAKPRTEIFRVPTSFEPTTSNPSETPRGDIDDTKESEEIATTNASSEPDSLNLLQEMKRTLAGFPDLMSESMSWEEEFDLHAQSTLYYHKRTGERTTDVPVDRIPDHTRAWYFFYCSPAFRRKINMGIRWDAEMEKLLSLALPYTAHTIVVNICGLLEVGIIGRSLGASDLSAYFATEFAISFATMFFHGILASLKVLVSQAHGAKNIKLAGMYVQIGVLTHHLLSLPLILYGWNNFDLIVLQLGLDEDTAESAGDYARFVFIYEAVGIYDGALHCVMDVTGHEKYSATSNAVRAVVSFLAVLIVSKVNQKAELWMVGAIHLIAKGLFVFFNICVILTKRWLDDYWNEWEPNPFKHWRHVKALWKSSLRLSSGWVIENCEWNILFVFAAIQGPAEVAIWGLVGKLWDFTDDIVIAISDASKVRCAQLLGSSLPEQARYSSEKSLLMGVTTSVVMSILLGFLQSIIPRWLTNDYTLQRLLGDMIPLLGLAVSTLSFGSICWSILCAQGRSHLATAVTGFGSLAIALPLACFSNFWFNFNPQGLIASLIIGYASSGFANAILMLTSDWSKISERVRKRTAQIEENLEKRNAFKSSTTKSSSDEGSTSMMII